VQLSQALKRVGAEVVKESVGDKDATFYLRVDPDQGQKWVECVTAFLLGLTKAYTVDLSKYFYASGGEVKYLWRCVIRGDVTQAQSEWAQCAMQAHMNNVPEITSFPLVGRVQYAYDPLRGKLKGVHDVDQAAGLVSMAIGGGAPGGVA
jgi:hypothetical protein